MITPRLNGVHPELVTSIERILATMAAMQHPMLVTDGVRTVEQQRRLYAIGRTVPGTVVTNCDGVTRLSPHQVRSDGYGHAVDCTFLVNGKVDWPETPWWNVYGGLAVHEGLEWGGLWKGTLVDRPHIERR